MRNESGKDIVSLGMATCPVCMARHAVSVLIQTRDITHPKLGRETPTGWAMCPEHQKLKDEGYVAMVVVTNTEQPTLENAKRTGDLLHVRESGWPHIFNMPLPPEGLAFIDLEAFTQVKAMVGES